VFDSFRVLREETFAGEQPTVLKRNVQIRHVGENRKALAFENRGMRVSHHRAVDEPAGDCLHARTGIADDSKGDAVALGINAPMFEGKHSEHPIAAAETRHADLFAFQICWRFDVMAYGEGAHQSFDVRGDGTPVESI